MTSQTLQGITNATVRFPLKAPSAGLVATLQWLTNVHLAQTSPPSPSLSSRSSEVNQHFHQTLNAAHLSLIKKQINNWWKVGMINDKRWSPAPAEWSENAPENLSLRGFIASVKRWRLCWRAAPAAPPPPHIILSAEEDNNQWDFQTHQHQKAI